MRRFSFLLLILIALSSFTVQNLTPVDGDNAVTFTIKNFGLNTKGSFSGLKGSIKWDNQNFASGAMQVTINVSTINTGVDARDNHLRSNEYFDAEKYPVIGFESTNITGSGNAGTITGNLTIKGVAKQITFPFTVNTAGNGFVFEGSFEINRRDFGVGKNSMVLGDNVTIKLHVTAQ